MEELEQAEAEKLFISAYWPRRNSDEMNIGYGISKTGRIYRIVGTTFSIINAVFSLFYEPKVRPAIQPGLRFIPLALLSLTLAMLSLRENKYQGYYQLDGNGVPTHYLNHLPPDIIKGRLGVGQKKFLERLAISE